MSTLFTNWNIRPATTGDLPILVEFNDRLAQETEGRRLNRDTVAAGVGQALARPEYCRYLVAETSRADGHPPQVVGQAMLTFEWSDWRNGLFWWLQSVYVRSDFRGRGVFRALAARIVNEARASDDCCGLRLYVEAHNQPALTTYGRLGFQPSGHLVYEIDWSGLEPVQASGQP